MQTACLETAFHEALEHHQAGRLSRAREIYQAVLDDHPGHPMALNLLGVIAHQQGDFIAAADLIERAIAANPHIAEFHNSLGNTYREQGRLAEAVRAYERALEIQPESAEIFTNLGAALAQGGNLEEAVACYLRALEIDPGYADAHYTLGNALQQAGNFEAAASSYRRAIGLAPQNAQAHKNLGNALLSLGDPAGAAESYRTAIAADPQCGAAHLGLGFVLQSLGKPGDAARAYQPAVILEPGSATAYAGLADAFAGLGRPEKSAACFRKALELAPGDAALYSRFLLGLHYDPSQTPESVFQAHREWNERHAKPLAAAIAPHRNRRDAEKRLRIGYVAPDFTRRAAGAVLAPVLAAQDSARFEAVCYSGSDREDGLSGQLRAAAGAWRETDCLGDAELAELIREDGVDILIDLAGHAKGTRLLAFARKPAPVTVTWTGCGATTGMDAMDYVVCDRWLAPPGSEQWYTERLLRLPDGYLCYEPAGDAPPLTELPALSRGYVTFGCFHDLAQVNTGVVLLWARLLRELPDARLVLNIHSLEDGEALRRYRKMFLCEGIAGDRVDFSAASPDGGPLAAYGAIDIALDSFPYSGGPATCDALWMGVPVVALSGDSAAGRRSTSHLNNAGLGELAAGTPEEYVAIACRLARDPGRLRAMRAGLRERVAASPLCDGKRFTRNLDAALRGAWRAWCANGH